MNYLEVIDNFNLFDYDVENDRFIVEHVICYVCLHDIMFGNNNEIDFFPGNIMDIHLDLENEINTGYVANLIKEKIEIG